LAGSVENVSGYFLSALLSKIGASSANPDFSTQLADSRPAALRLIAEKPDNGHDREDCNCQRDGNLNEAETSDP